MRRLQRQARAALLAPALTLAAVLAGCGEAEDPVGSVGNEVGPPLEVDATYRWVLQGWESGGVEPIGVPAVDVTWSLPQNWNGEAFRVYGRRSNAANYLLLATVTSCGDGTCLYTDLNVAHGQEYEYYVTTLDEQDDEEIASTEALVEVPDAMTPDAPGAPAVTALDGALYLQWESTGAAVYRIFLERIGAESVFYEIGETDGTAFLDERAENGEEYLYRVVGVDEWGHVSARGALGGGIPRPDYHAELIWSAADTLGGSGFRFQAEEGASPIVAGDASTAQWRLETVNGMLTIRPMGATLVTAGEFTTALTCGPGSDADCEDVDQAPALASFGSTPVAVEVGNTYVFRVADDQGQNHYGKIRVQGVATDRGIRPVVVFDWAYQTQPNQPSLSISPAR